jgi:ABC-type bacteriocin/lantibiotic exporter with double-glycine peptidase domain
MPPKKPLMPLAMKLPTGSVMSLRAAMRMMPLAEDGTGITDVADAAWRLGLGPKLLWANYAGLCATAKPAIVHMIEGHFELVEFCNADHVALASFWGQRRVGGHQFNSRWSGAMIAFDAFTDPDSEIVTEDLDHVRCGF